MKPTKKQTKQTACWWWTIRCGKSEKKNRQAYCFWVLMERPLMAGNAVARTNRNNPISTPPLLSSCPKLKSQFPLMHAFSPLNLPELPLSENDLGICMSLWRLLCYCCRTTKVIELYFVLLTSQYSNEYINYYHGNDRQWSTLILGMVPTRACTSCDICKRPKLKRWPLNICTRKTV